MSKFEYITSETIAKIQRHNIDSIVFDFGGVLIDLDIDRTYQALSDLLGIHITKNQLSEERYHFFNDYEKGLLRDETFIWNIQRCALKNTPQPRDVVDAWNAMLLGWQPAKLQQLYVFRNHYDVYILSNTNALHLQWVTQDLRANHDIHDFDERYFDKSYYSHIVKMRKPDKPIYQYVIEDAGLVPERTLFVDDSYENLRAPAMMGMNVLLHKTNDALDYLINHLAV